jgi:hypothetical protein
LAEAGLALGTGDAGWAKVELGDVSAEAERKVRSKKDEVRIERTGGAT